MMIANITTITTTVDMMSEGVVMDEEMREDKVQEEEEEIEDQVMEEIEDMKRVDEKVLDNNDMKAHDMMIDRNVVVIVIVIVMIVLIPIVVILIHEMIIVLHNHNHIHINPPHINDHIIVIMINM
jgi:hypothetical protein